MKIKTYIINMKESVERREPGSEGGLPLFFPGYRMGGGCEREATHGGTDRTVI